MLTTYNTLKFLHVAAVIIWVGGGFALGILNARLSLTGDRAAIEVLSRQTLFYLRRVIGPAAALVLLAGIGMTVVGHIPPGSFWIVWGYVGIAGFVVLGVILSGRAAAELARLAPTATEADLRIVAVRKRLRILGMSIGLLMATVVWAMVFKPTF
jgi:hypothetical protein